MLHLGTHMTHVAEMNGTNNVPGHPSLPKVLISHTPNGPEPLGFSAQLRKEQKQRHSRRCLVSAKSHHCVAAPPGPLVASPNQQCESFVLSGVGVGAPSPHQAPNHSREGR